MAKMPERQPELSGAERQAADLVAQAINADVSNTIGLKVKLFQMDIEQHLALCRQAIEKAIVKHNLPVKVNMHIGLEVDETGIRKEVTRKVKQAFKGELTEQADNMTLY